MKKCSSCRITKDLTNYTGNKYKKDGLSATCRECDKSRRTYSRPPIGKTYADYLKESQERECYNKKNEKKKVRTHETER